MDNELANLILEVDVVAWKMMCS